MQGGLSDHQLGVGAAHVEAGEDAVPALRTQSSDDGLQTGWGQLTRLPSRAAATVNSPTLFDAAVPKLSSSDAVSVVIFPVTPEMWKSRSPSSCTELNLKTAETQRADLSGPLPRGAGGGVRLSLT